MVNLPETLPIAAPSDPEQALALSYAPAATRSGLAVLLALDERLGGIVRTATNPMVATLRLAWWREALEALDDAPAPAEPVLAALSSLVLPRGVRGGMLATTVAGWERLLDSDPLDATQLDGFALERGAGLFVAAATVLGEKDHRIEAAGEGWALADLAMRWSRTDVAQSAAAAARMRFQGLFVDPWPPSLRPLGALTLMARADLAVMASRRGSPRRVGRMLWHRLSGR